MRFEVAFQGWSGGRLTQTGAAMLLGQSERSFRRHVERYKADGLAGPLDKRLSQISKCRADRAEVNQAVQTYKSGFAGWNVAHFHSKYRSELQGTRSFSWVKTVLQGAGLVRTADRRDRQQQGGDGGDQARPHCRWWGAVARSGRRVDGHAMLPRHRRSKPW